MMKKEMLLKGLLGFPLGIAIAFIITLLISICVGDGSYYAVTPELLETAGNELNAVILQTVLSGVVGSGFGAASVIWKIDSWSLVKQSGIYFAIACAVMFPTAYVANWMEHTIGGVLSYILIFTAIFIIVWLTQYGVWRSKVKKMNEKVNGRG